MKRFIRTPSGLLGIITLLVLLLFAVSSVWTQQTISKSTRRASETLRAVKLASDQNSCRAQLSATNEIAQTEFFSSIISQPPDLDRIQAALARLNQIADARKDSAPCHALRALPASVRAPSPGPVLPTTTTTTTTTPVSSPPTTLRASMATTTVPPGSPNTAKNKGLAKK